MSLIATTAIFGFGIAPASAHDQLIGTTPNAGATLHKLPASVKLRFNEAVLHVGTDVNVTHNGRNYGAGKPTVSGSTVTQRLKDGLPDGSYRVTWRVVSADGHPVGNSFKFSIRVAAASPAPATPTASTASSTASPATATAASPSPASSASSTGMPSWAWTIIVAVIGLAVLVSLVTWLGRRRP